VCVCCYVLNQPSKRRRFLLSSEIAELFLDTDSDDARDASSFAGVPEGVPGVSHTHPYRQTTSSPDSSSSISASASEEDEAIESVPGKKTRQAVTLQWTSPLLSEQCSTHINWGSQRKEGQRSVPHKGRLQST